MLQKTFVNAPKQISAKCLFWRSCAGLHTNVECSSRIHCQNYRFQPSTTLGGGVKRVKTVFVVSFGLKKLIPSSFWEILFTIFLFVYLTALIDFRINKVIAFPLPFPVCLPLKHGSDRHETSPKRVSDDSRHFIFRRKTNLQNFERSFTP